MSVLKFRAYDGENFWHFTSEIGVFYKHIGGEQSSFDDYLEFSEVLDQGWPVDQWTTLVDKHGVDIYFRDKLETINGIILNITWDNMNASFSNVSKASDGRYWHHHDSQNAHWKQGKVIGNTHEDSK